MCRSPQSKATTRRADWRNAASPRSEAGAVAGIHRCPDLTLSRGRAPFLLLFGMDGQFDELTILLVSILIGAAAAVIVFGGFLMLQPYHP